MLLPGRHPSRGRHRGSEATQRLFAGHSVRELSHAYADNLTGTFDAIARAMAVANREGLRAICFITGVPGAGKRLLASLLFMRPRAALTASGRCLPVGNGPLVRILREAIARDAAAKGQTLRDARRKAEHLVQNVHVFIEEYGVRHRHQAPPEHVIIFDEAQRAWDAHRLAKRHKGTLASEAALVLDAMSRLPGVRSWRSSAAGRKSTAAEPDSRSGAARPGSLTGCLARHPLTRGAARRTQRCPPPALRWSGSVECHG